ncbi:MAG TPA: hypothetical protein VE732_05810 [Nitrososphaera sp.]|jgi:hypothetical protein|nr:hypothetical protein [Nitrososphaera sp.]
MLKEKADRFATWLTITILSLVVVFITPTLKDSRLLDRLIGAALATPFLVWVYNIVRTRRLKSLAKRIIGEWTYITFPHDPSKRAGNYSFGWMRFFVDETNNLRYEVQLFVDKRSLLDSVYKGFSSSGAIGRAHDRAFRYNPENKSVWLIYEATYNQPDRKSRTGYLYLDFSNPKRPTGYWASDLDKSFLSAGEIHICKPDEFNHLVDSFLPAN